MQIKKLWVEEYRPKTIDGYVFQHSNQKSQIQRMINEQDIPNLLLCGIQGSGKTTLARILIKALNVDDMDVLEINASDKTGIDYIRDTILSFTESYPMGKFKIVHLEEFDYMSHQAQGMLRAVMEQASDTCRFICTCNYVNKILPAIQSRMQVMQFKAPDQESLIGRLVEMLVIENVDFDENDLILYLQQAYPDVRKIINNLQLNTVDDKLLSPKDDSGNGDYKFELIKHIHECDIASIRKMLATQIPSEEIESLYEVLYQNLTSIKGVNKNSDIMDKLILVIADHLRSHAISAFPYITMESCLIKMMMVINEEI